MVAAACIITSVDGLLFLPKNDANSYRILKSLSKQILYQLHTITGIEKVCYVDYVTLIARNLMQPI